MQDSRLKATHIGPALKTTSESLGLWGRNTDLVTYDWATYCTTVTLWFVWSSTTLVIMSVQARLFRSPQMVCLAVAPPWIIFSNLFASAYAHPATMNKAILSSPDHVYRMNPAHHYSSPWDLSLFFFLSSFLSFTVILILTFWCGQLRQVFGLSHSWTGWPALLLLVYGQYGVH